MSKKPRLTIKQILAWADAHHKRTGTWPSTTSGPVHDAPERTWEGIGRWLYNARGGVRRRSSLARLLAKHRGVPKYLHRHRGGRVRPPLTLPQILAWADAYRDRTGEWPGMNSGPVPESPGETWRTIDSALRDGRRGVQRSSLPQVLAAHRGVRKAQRGSRLTVKRILSWANAHYQRTGKWPTQESGAVYETPGENWAAISQALRSGHRGLPSGLSLARLLDKYHGTGRVRHRPRVTAKQILTWAEAHHKRTGQWPTVKSGAVAEAVGENWGSLSHALRDGARGLPGGSSLARLLAKHRGVQWRTNRPLLTVKQILAWADAHYQKTGRYPVETSGPVHGVPRASWRSLSEALRLGRRGLPGGSSLSRLLAERRGVQQWTNRPRLTVGQILAWADAHYQRTGEYPTPTSGPVHGVPWESWAGISEDLRLGRRSLRGRSSLPQLLAKHRRGPRRATPQV